MASIEQQRIDAMARDARRRAGALPVRPDGVRVRLTAERGLTKGDAADVLRIPYAFQCAPMESLARPVARTWNRETNYKGDERLDRGGRQLRTLAFRTLAVEAGGFVTVRWWDVDWMVQALERLVAAGQPFRLLATKPWSDQPLADMTCVLEQFTPTLQAGENDAEYLDLTFTEFPDRPTTRRALGDRFPFTIELRKDGSYSGLDARGEPLTLQVIAKYAYGLPSLARRVGLAQKGPLKEWGVATPLIRHPKYRGKGGRIVVPEPPTTAYVSSQPRFSPGSDGSVPGVGITAFPAD